MTEKYYDFLNLSKMIKVAFSWKLRICHGFFNIKAFQMQKKFDIAAYDLS